MSNPLFSLWLRSFQIGGLKNTECTLFNLPYTFDHASWRDNHEIKRHTCSTGGELCSKWYTSTFNSKISCFKDYLLSPYYKIADSCLGNPCDNGGTCVNLGGNSYRCNCLAGSSGQTCETIGNIFTISWRQILFQKAKISLLKVLHYSFKLKIFLQFYLARDTNTQRCCVKE